MTKLDTAQSPGNGLTLYISHCVCVKINKPKKYFWIFAKETNRVQHDGQSYLKKCCFGRECAAAPGGGEVRGVRPAAGGGQGDPQAQLLRLQGNTWKS